MPVFEAPSPTPPTSPQAKAARIALPAGPAIALLRAALEPRSSLLPDAAQGGQPTMMTPMGLRRSAATPASPPGTADALGLGLSSLGLSSPPPPQQQQRAAAPIMSPPGASKGSGSAPPAASDPFLHFSITGLLASSPGMADECARIATLSVAAASREPLASPPPSTTRLRSLAGQVRETLCARAFATPPSHPTFPPRAGPSPRRPPAPRRHRAAAGCPVRPLRPAPRATPPPRPRRRRAAAAATANVARVAAVWPRPTLIPPSCGESACLRSRWMV